MVIIEKPEFTFLLILKFNDNSQVMIMCELTRFNIGVTVLFGYLVQG